MDSQSSNKPCAAPLAPSTDGEPTAGHPPDVTQIQMWIQRKLWRSGEPRTQIRAPKTTCPTGPEPLPLVWGSAHPGQPPNSAPDRYPPCCVPASRLPDQSKCSSSCPRCYYLSSDCMAWGQCCQPRRPHQPEPLLSHLLPPVFHIPWFCVTLHARLSSSAPDGKHSRALSCFSPNVSMVPWWGFRWS